MQDEPTRAITRLLTDDSMDGDDRARRLLPLIYEELRGLARQRMANERAGHTLQATALVHEAYIRLLGDAHTDWRGRGHFFAAAAEAMRRILVEQARRRDALKRGGDRQRVDLDGPEVESELVGGIEPADASVDLIALDGAIAALEAESWRRATLVKLRYFTGLTLEQAAEALDISPTTADRDWAYAKAFLYAEVRQRRES